jgi:hypothetical protein
MADDIYIPTLQDFIALVRQNPFSRVDRFLVNFGMPKALANTNSETVRNMSLLCEEASIPGRTIGTRTLRINGLNEQRAHTMDFMGDSIKFTFLVNVEWKIRTFFDMWMTFCVGGVASRNTHPPREVGFYQDYISDVTIYATNPEMASDDTETAGRQFPSLLNTIKLATGKLPPFEAMSLENMKKNEFIPALASPAKNIFNLERFAKKASTWGVEQLGLDSLLKREVAKQQAKAALILSNIPGTNKVVNRAMDILNDKFNELYGDRLTVAEVISNRTPAESLLQVQEPEVKPVPNKSSLKIDNPKIAKDSLLYGVTLHEAWPKSISMHPMSSSSIDQYHRLEVVFTYKWYTINGQVIPESVHDINFLSALPTGSF